MDELPSLSTKDEEAERFWNVPNNRNPHFTGRERVLELLARALDGNDAETRSQVLHGVGGVGKTQVAVEYAYRHRDQHELVWWLPAQDDAALAVAVARMVRTLGGNPPLDSTPDELREALEEHLKTFGRWLLIFDNAPGPEAVRAYLPRTGTRGALIITSRDPGWKGVAQSFCLRVFERPDSLAFLKNRTGRNDPPAVAQRLAQALGDLPLALEQAGAVIVEAKLTYAQWSSKRLR